MGKIAVAVKFGDGHADRNAWSSRPTLWGDAIHSFRCVTSKAHELEVALIAAGDLIDVRRPEPWVVNMLRMELDVLASDDIPFYYIQGQHELDRKNPWMSSIHSHAEHIHKRSIELGEIPHSHAYNRVVNSVNIYGLDWTPADNLERELKEIPKSTDVFICHQVWHEFMGDIAYEGTLRDICAPWVFTGDFHENKELLVENVFGNSTRVISPGSTNIRRINESPKKYAYILYDDLSWERFSIPTRYLLRYEIYKEADLDKAEADIPVQLETTVVEHNLSLGLPEQLQAPIIDVKYSDKVDNVWSRLNKVCGKDSHLFLRVVAASDDDDLSVEQQQFQEILDEGPEACLQLLLDSDADIYKLGLRFIQSQNFEEEILAARGERGLCD